MSVYDTSVVHVQIINKPNHRKDTVKTVVVSEKTFEEKCSSVQKVYTSQIGVTELTGHNDGVQVEKYLASVGLPKGFAYCAAGCHWSFMTAGVKTTINAAAASTFNKNNLVYLNRVKLKNPIAGADVIQFWIPSLNGIHHCGFWDKEHGNGMYESVEFNTSVGSGIFQEGGGVGRKIRSYNATYAISRWIK